MSGPIPAHLTEGPEKKGGVNGPTQIPERPAPPPAMQSELGMASRYGRMQGILDLITDVVEMHDERLITSNDAVDMVRKLAKRGVAIGAGK
jgi:hypothetical protein